MGEPQVPQSSKKSVEGKTHRIAPGHFSTVTAQTLSSVGVTLSSSAESDKRKNETKLGRGLGVRGSEWDSVTYGSLLDFCASSAEFELRAVRAILTRA